MQAWYKLGADEHTHRPSSIPSNLLRIIPEKYADWRLAFHLIDLALQIDGSLIKRT